ncbi:MAG: Gldg family protein, partial [Candidatus Hydrogenedentes bacterium]|nr:Gldg family protein [Candidatus Hydrogenedentota bacterium]
MNNIKAIMRRDLSAYFTSPVGYIFMMVFVTISVGLYITSFFSFPMADMRPYFDNLPLLLCVFIPAVTMRIWAEERKENTWEMLLTFPMEARELVLGKFFAALIFFALTLLSTVTVPVMLMSLGEPDVGAIISGYVGTLLLGGFFLSLGIFFSGFFKDQIVAFAVTLLTCFSFFLVGTGFIASYIDDRVPGLGSMLSDLLGLFGHYSPFTRGVIDLADIAYFLVWTIAFLVLNTIYIDGRNRPGAKAIFSGALVMSLAIGLLFNYLMAGSSLLRFDVTEDKIYTISPASKEILSELDTTVQLKVYITSRDKMPTGMKELEQNIVDKLEEMRIASGGTVDYTTIYMDVANVYSAPNADKDEEGEEKEEDAIEKRMLAKGVQPFNVQAMSQDEMTSKLVYSSIGVGYEDKAEEILPQIVPQSLQELEYRLVNTIHKMAREKAPVVALVAPKEAVNIDPQMRQILMQMGQPVPDSEDPYEYLQQVLEYEKYTVERVELTKESPLPDEYDTLAIINPRSLNDRQRWEISRALESGKSVIMAVQTYEWDYRSTPQGLSINRREETPGVNELLESYGLGVSTDILMDVNKVPLSIQGGGNTLQDMLRGPQQVNLPMHILVNNTSMSEDTAITNRLSALFYLWGTALDMDESKLGELGLDADVIMETSDRAWSIPSSAQLTGTSFEEPQNAERKAFPLMARVKGQFPDAFADAERPAWPKAQPPQPQFGQPPAPPEDDTPEAPAEAVEAKPGELILLGCSETFRKNFLRDANLDLFLNSVDAVTLNEKLAEVRGRKAINRMIDRPDDSTKSFWRAINYALANALIAGIGIAFLMHRRPSRHAHKMA